MSTIHVLPIGDVIEHELPGGWDGHGPGCSSCKPGEWLNLASDPDVAEDDTDCLCGPMVELVPNPDGPDGWIVVHHALDGRENHEPGSTPAALARDDG